MTLPSLPSVARAMTGPRNLARYAALDGYRGLFIILVMLYHFGVTSLAGGWVGINHFFVFSGFLITRLLVKEHARTGRINPLRFYQRRARRILPAMFVLVAAVLVHTALVGSPTDRDKYGGDAFATLGFFMNWRLISQHDQYFDQFSTPSPLRHVWTLAVEEQFYVFAPFLILLLCVVWRRRPARAAVGFALAVVSTVWTAHVGFEGISDLPRVYYGTDTRAQALLVGVGMGLLLGVDRRGREPAQLSRSATHVLAWIGFGVSLGAIFVLSPTSEWIYNTGGMLLFACGAALMGFAAIDQRGLAINRLFSWGPLVYLGRISYGLYLYHWPIHLWLPLDGLPGWLSGTIQMLLSLAVAMISFHYLELPVLRDGVRAVLRWPSWMRAAPAAVGVTVVLFAASLGLWRTGSTSLADVPALHGAQAEYHPGGQSVRFALVGGSVASSLAAGWVSDRYRDEHLNDQTLLGCDLIDAPIVHDGRTREAEPQCDRWRTTWPDRVRSSQDDTVVLVAAEQFLVAHRTSEGVVRPGTKGMSRLIQHTLSTIWHKAQRAGVEHMQVVNIPCRRIDAQQLDPSLRFFAAKGSDDQLVDWANTSIRQWVRGHDDVTLLDLNHQLCASGYRRTVHGIGLYHDTVHFSRRGAAMVWTWLAPAIRDAARPDDSKG